VLSEKNEKLLKDLKIKDFFEEYEKASTEVKQMRNRINVNLVV